MSTETPIVFTSNALELIRDLTEKGTNIAMIRGALFRQSKVWFKDIDIIAAAETFGLTLTSVNTGRTTRFDVQKVALLTDHRGRPIDKVGLVKPGTYHTPGGYRIGPRGTLAAIAAEAALKVSPARRKRGAHG